MTSRNGLDLPGARRLGSQSRRIGRHGRMSAITLITTEAAAQHGRLQAFWLVAAPDDLGRRCRPLPHIFDVLPP